VVESKGSSRVSRPAALVERYNLKNATIFGGASLIDQFLQLVELPKVLAAKLTPHEKAKQSRYSLFDEVLMLLIRRMLGLGRIADFSTIEHDPLLARLLGLPKLPDVTIPYKDLARFAAKPVRAALQRCTSMWWASTSANLSSWTSIRPLAATSANRWRSTGNWNLRLPAQGRHHLVQVQPVPEMTQQPRAAQRPAADVQALGLRLRRRRLLWGEQPREAVDQAPDGLRSSWSSRTKLWMIVALARRAFASKWSSANWR